MSPKLSQRHELLILVKCSSFRAFAGASTERLLTRSFIFPALAHHQTPLLSRPCFERRSSSIILEFVALEDFAADVSPALLLPPGDVRNPRESLRNPCPPGVIRLLTRPDALHPLSLEGSAGCPADCLTRARTPGSEMNVESFFLSLVSMEVFTRLISILPGMEVGKSDAVNHDVW